MTPPTLALGPALLALVLAGLPAAAAEARPAGEGPRPGTADRAPPAQGHNVYEGKIASLDATRGQLTLSGMPRMNSPAGKETTASPARTATFTFTTDRNVQVTLDGRTADFAALRPGMFAWVHTRPGAGGGPAARGDTAKRDADDRAAGTASPMTAHRIDAFSKAPPARTTPGKDTDKVGGR
jgi:hypothetical protein